MQADGFLMWDLSGVVDFRYLVVAMGGGGVV